jgi:CHAP domain
VSLETTLARIAAIRGMTAPPPVTTAPPAAPASSAGTVTAHASSVGFAGALAQAQGAPGAAPGGAGTAIVAAAQGEVGQAEFPPGSNDSPRIAQYRQATAGAVVGPWCGYFASWAAAQAGAPLGDRGEGFGSVDALWSWAQRSGRALGAGSVPQPGDLIVFDEHVGVVEGVLPDGRIQTIEGNSSDQVARRVHAPGEALGYVRTG